MQPAPAGLAAASFVIVDPGGHRSRIQIHPLPFLIGRQPDCHLIIRDSRASRTHAQVTAHNGEYVLEDLGSLHGTHVNGRRVTRHVLHNSDRVEFGVPESYQLIFTLDGAEMRRMMDQFAGQEKAAGGPGGNLAKLRAILDLARTLQTSFSTEDVLKSVVDAGLAITGAERGFLLLRNGDALETRTARNRHGATLDATELQVPRQVIHRALEHRRELLHMN